MPESVRSSGSLELSAPDDCDRLGMPHGYRPPPRKRSTGGRFDQGSSEVYRTHFDLPEREVTDARLIGGLLSVGAALCALAIWLILAEIH